MKYTAAAIVFLVGCNWAFGLEPTQSRDAPPQPDAAPDAPGCSGARFQPPTSLAVMGSLNNFGDADMPDPLHLWFAQEVNQQRDIFRAERARESDPFGAPVAEAAVNASSEADDDPAVTSDGLDMFFTSYRTARWQVYEARRTSTTEPFGAPLTVAQLSNTEPGAGVDVSRDGLTVYVTDRGPGTYDLYSLHRDARDQPFGAPSAVLAHDVAWPSVSPDGLELFYTPSSTGTGIVRRVRTSGQWDQPFDESGAAEPVDTTLTDPDVTPDATHLVVTTTAGFAVMSRTCN